MTNHDKSLFIIHVFTQRFIKQLLAAYLMKALLNFILGWTHHMPYIYVCFQYGYVTEYTKSYSFSLPFRNKQIQGEGNTNREISLL